MSSLMRPVMRSAPAASSAARSPVRTHAPSAVNAAAVSSGRPQ